VKAVNLLPPDIRGASTKATAELATGPEAKGGAGPFVVLGVLAACVAGTAAYVLTNNTIQQRTSDLAAVTARQQALQQQAAKLKPYADFGDVARERVATLRDLAGRRFDWNQALRDLSRAVPAGVTLSSLSGDLGPGSGSSATTSSSGLRSAIDAPAITLDGCTRDQRSVARLMARLRDVDGVTRVTLSKSVENTALTGTSTGGASPPCGTGVRPTFEMVIFFGGDAAAVAAPAGTTGATGATGGTSSPAATPSASATPAPGATATATPSPTGSSADSTTSNGGPTK
jgi:Tfp pilus assembly protein PilN